MFVYCILLGVLSLCSLVEIMCITNTGWKEHRKICIVSFIAYALFLIILVFHSENMGVDSNNYKIMFEMSKSASWKELFKIPDGDYGYLALNKFIGYFTDDFWVVRCIIHTITLILLYFVINKKSKYPATSVLIYVAMCNFYTFYVLREALAISICFLGFYYLEENQTFKYIILVILACSLHQSALVGIFIIIFKLMFKRKINLLQLGLLLVMMAGGIYMLVPHIIRLYKNGRYVGLSSDGGITLFCVLLFMMIFLSFYIYEYKKNNKKEIAFQYNLLCCSLLIQLGALWAGILTRARFYVAIFLILLIPELLYAEKKIVNRIIYDSVIICACWMWFFVATSSQLYEYVPHAF